MSYNAINLNYELEDLNINLFDHAGINKLVLVENEKLNKFVSKSILFYILNELNHDIITEYHIIGIGTADLYDLSARVVYIFDPCKLNEYQTMISNLYPNSEVDVIAINIEDLPNDLFQRYLKLKEYIMQG